MYARLISGGITYFAPKPKNCFTGETPTADCILLGGIPWGKCDKGAG
ncbi:MAG: hypothetical protein HXS48_25600 [Theionarchaea archaeon]|nr:hypothetical protein [Theionarchaea archaeon]